MWQARLLLLAATLFSHRLHVAGQQIPDCTRRCITINATPGCDIKNIGCLCRTQSSHAAVPQCISSICASSGAQTAISAFDNLCIAAGVGTNTTSPAPPPQGSPTSSPPSLPSSPSTSQPPAPPRSTSKPINAGQSSPSSSSSISTSTSPSDDHVTVPPGSASPSQSQSSTAVGAAPSDSTTQDATVRSFSSGGLIGSIIGGLGGGLLVVAIIGCFLWRRHKRSTGFESIEISHLSSSNTIRPIVLGGSALKTHKRLDSGSSGYPLRYRDSPDPYLSPVTPGDEVAAAALAVRPLVLDTSGRTYPRRKGDPPPLPPALGPGPSSPFTDVQSSVSTDHLSPGRTESPAVHVPSADLTPSQLDIVQTMVNRGVHGSAVVDVIQRMIADNATPAPPEYDYADSPAR